MIPKVVPPRKDGHSSFRHLTNYITKELAMTMVDIERPGFGNLTQYITRENILDSLGDGIEKTIAVETGSIISLRTAATEMYYVAERNRRVKDPVFHYILSWPSHEHPPARDIIAAARYTIDALGMADHQYVIAVHANTDNLHAHIEINRVHPLTFMSHHIEWAHKTLHRAARDIEIEFGWDHDEGLFKVIEVDGKKIVVDNMEYAGERGLSSSAAQVEVWSGLESLESYCRGQPAEALREALANGTVNSWEDLHKIAGGYGLSLEDAGGGGLRVVAMTESGTVGVAASKAFRFLKRADLESAWGQFSQMDNNTKTPELQQVYKRNPMKRLVRRIERAEAREALLDRYRKDKQGSSQFRKQVADIIRAEIKVQRLNIQALHRQMRQSVRTDSELDARARMVAYSMLAHQRRRDYEALRNYRTTRFQQLAEDLAPVPMVRSWREWLQMQADLGDPAAISALRGLIYQDGRKRKKGGGGHEEASLSPAADQAAEFMARDFQNLIWRHQAGSMLYAFAGGAPAFVDEGNRITWGRVAVDDDSLRLAMDFAREKWGNKLKIDGGDDAFKERMVDEAIRLGIDIVNPELSAYVAHRRSLLEGAGEGSITIQPPIEKVTRDIARYYPDMRLRNSTELRQSLRGKVIGFEGDYAVIAVGKKDIYVVPRASLAGDLQKDGAVTLQASGRHGKSEKEK